MFWRQTDISGKNVTRYNKICVGLVMPKFGKLLIFKIKILRKVSYVVGLIVLNVMM